MKEAKDTLKEELKKVEFNVTEIIELAKRLDVVNITVEELSEAVDAYNDAEVVNTSADDEETKTMYIEGLDQSVEATPEVIERERKIKEDTDAEMQRYMNSLKTKQDEALNDAVEVAHVEALEEDAKRERSQAFALECAEASNAAEQAQDIAQLDAEEHAEDDQKLHTSIQANLDNVETLKTATKRADAYRELYIETHKQLLERQTPKARSRVSNLAVVTDELKSTNGSAARGEKARDAIAADAQKHMQITNITFDRRGKYKDWFICGTDADGQEFAQRLDAFKSKLKSAMNITK